MSPEWLRFPFQGELGTLNENKTLTCHWEKPCYLRTITLLSFKSHEIGGGGGGVVGGLTLLRVVVVSFIEFLIYRF